MSNRRRLHEQISIASFEFVIHVQVADRSHAVWADGGGDDVSPLIWVALCSGEFVHIRGWLEHGLIEGVSCSASRFVCAPRGVCAGVPWIYWIRACSAFRRRRHRLRLRQSAKAPVKTCGCRFVRAPPIFGHGRLRKQRRGAGQRRHVLQLCAGASDFVREERVASLRMDSGAGYNYTTQRLLGASFKRLFQTQHVVHAFARCCGHSFIYSFIHCDIPLLHNRRLSLCAFCSELVAPHRSYPPGEYLTV